MCIENREKCTYTFMWMRKAISDIWHTINVIPFRDSFLVFLKRAEKSINYLCLLSEWVSMLSWIKRVSKSNLKCWENFSQFFLINDKRQTREREREKKKLEKSQKRWMKELNWIEAAAAAWTHSERENLERDFGQWINYRIYHAFFSRPNTHTHTHKLIWRWKIEKLIDTLT